MSFNIYLPVIALSAVIITAFIYHIHIVRPIKKELNRLKRISTRPNNIAKCGLCSIYDHYLDKLNEREIKILKLIGQGKISQEIADELFVSKKTIDADRAKLVKILELSTSAELPTAAVMIVLSNPDIMN